MPGFRSSGPGIFCSDLKNESCYMKLIRQTAVLFLVAIVCGAGGYILGKKQSLDPKQSEGSKPSQRPREKSSTVPRQLTSAAIDLKQLREKLDAEKSPLARFKLALENLEEWIKQNPEEALKWLASQPPTVRRDEVMRMALEQFAESDPKGAADWASKNLSGVDLNNMLILIAASWARENGQEAASWFQGQPATQERNAALETIFFNWASNEPAAALEFLKANSSLSDVSPTLRKAALAGWAKSEPEAAVNASLAWSKANNTPAQFANTLANWATVDLDASSRWLLDKLPAGIERSTAAEQLATIFAQQSPQAGATWLEKLNAGEERNKTASRLIAEWSRNDPAGAMQWAGTQTSSNLSPAATMRAGHNFIMQDQAAFETWRAALPAGPLKELMNQVQGPEAAQEDEGE
jgi:hypothetical protein